MSGLPIDLDAEAIFYEGHWYTREELARRIKGMLDEGDFAVGRPSVALEQLSLTLASLRTLAFRAQPELLDALNQAATVQGRTVSGLIRDALGEYLGLPAQTAAPTSPERPPPTGRPGRRPTHPELPATEPIPLDLTQPMADPPPQLFAPRGSSKPSSPTVVVDPSALAESGGEGALEPAAETPQRGWFGR